MSQRVLQLVTINSSRVAFIIDSINWRHIFFGELTAGDRSLCIMRRLQTQACGDEQSQSCWLKLCSALLPKQEVVSLFVDRMLPGIVPTCGGSALGATRQL